MNRQVTVQCKRLRQNDNDEDHFCKPAEVAGKIVPKGLLAEKKSLWFRWPAINWFFTWIPDFHNFPACMPIGKPYGFLVMLF